MIERLLPAAFFFDVYNCYVTKQFPQFPNIENLTKFGEIIIFVFVRHKLEKIILQM